jgi:hypothetical protein
LSSLWYRYTVASPTLKELAIPFALLFLFCNASKTKAFFHRLIPWDDHPFAPLLLRRQNQPSFFLEFDRVPALPKIVPLILEGLIVAIPRVARLALNGNHEHVGHQPQDPTAEDEAGGHPAAASVVGILPFSLEFSIVPRLDLTPAHCDSGPLTAVNA